MKWIADNMIQIGTTFGSTGAIAGIFYFTILNKLDARYMTEKECGTKEKVTNVMLKSIKDDVIELKETNKTIFQKLDKITDHLINNKVA